MVCAQKEQRGVGHNRTRTDGMASAAVALGFPRPVPATRASALLAPEPSSDAGSMTPFYAENRIFGLENYQINMYDIFFADENVPVKE